jgi:hypothetical protein
MGPEPLLKETNKPNIKIPSLTPSSSHLSTAQFPEDFVCSPTDPGSFSLPKSKVKLLRKTASVKQMYNSVLQGREASGTRGGGGGK